MWVAFYQSTFRFPAGNQLTNLLHTKWVIKEMLREIEKFGFGETLSKIRDWLEYK